MRDYEKLSDDELARLLKKDNISAFEEIYNRYWSRLYNAARKRINHAEVCQEIIQDLFTSLWLGRKKLRIHATLAGYLLTAVRYKVFNHIEKEVVRRNYRESLPDEFHRIDNSTEETVLLNDLNQQLEEEITLLPEKCRRVFELSRKEQKTNKEIALELNISEKTVENHITKALRLLRAGLKDSVASFLL